MSCSNSLIQYKTHQLYDEAQGNPCISEEMGARKLEDDARGGPGTAAIRAGFVVEQRRGSEKRCRIHVAGC